MTNEKVLFAEPVPLQAIQPLAANSVNALTDVSNWRSFWNSVLGQEQRQPAPTFGNPAQGLLGLLQPQPSLPTFGQGLLPHFGAPAAPSLPNFAQLAALLPTQQGAPNLFG